MGQYSVWNKYDGLKDGMVLMDITEIIQLYIWTGVAHLGHHELCSQC